MKRSRLVRLAALLALLVAAVAWPQAASARTHRVKKGESLWAIAQKYRIGVARLCSANRWPREKPIHVGQQLRIPKKRQKSKARAANKAATASKRALAPLGDKPTAQSQTQKSVVCRGGINPCNTRNPGNGVYTRWDRAPSIGQMIMPVAGGLTRDGRFDVMFHFHGHEAVRKEWVQVMDGAVLVGIDLGLGAGPYWRGFGAPGTFKRLVASVERAMAKHTGRKRVRVRHVGLSAWSAGYGAVGRILSQSYGRQLVKTVVLLDGMHTAYVGQRLDVNQLKPFIDFGRRAVKGDRFMFISHSSIIPPGYASSTETARYLVRQLGGKPRRAKPRRGDPWGLELNSRYDRAGLHVRGFDGNDKMDHCAHIGLFRDILKVHVKPRWRSPRGRKSKSRSAG